MAFPRGGGAWISAPRLLTVMASLLLVGVALASFRFALPHPLAAVTGHRFGLVVAGYAVLLGGVLLRRL